MGKIDEYMYSMTREKIKKGSINEKIVKRMGLSFTYPPARSFFHGFSIIDIIKHRFKYRKIKRYENAISLLTTAKIENSGLEIDRPIYHAVFIEISRSTK